MAREIFGRCADDALELAKLARDERLVQRRSGTHRDVYSVSHHVEVAVLHDELDLHFRIARDEAGHRRHQPVRGEPDARMQEELAARLIARAPHLPFRVFELADDAPAAREEQSAFDGGGDLARGAIEE